MSKWRKGALSLVFAALALAGCDMPRNDAQAPAAPGATAAQTQNAAPAYYVTVDLRQSHFTLDPFEHARDSWNAVEFALPASKAQYDRLNKGDNLVDKFRSASFWIDGSIGSTKMTVEGKPAVRADADATAYKVKLQLYQSNLSLDPFKHLKNSGNAIEFNWEVPGNVYNEMKVGDDLIKDGFRTGSFVLKGSVGKWHLKVAEKNGPSLQPAATKSPAR
ncbi:MAG TPA: hypothetical protein VEF76_08480 [Patescibacteria group bacterium]|nr:hypothetical protein [Patescibacteria group bacterium]